MSMLDLRTATLNDIVFEGRNKLYGAYVLRQLYERHLVKALAIAVTLTLLLVSSPLVKAWLFPPMIEAAGPVVLPDQGTVLIEPPIIAEPKPAGGQPKAVQPVIHPPTQTVPTVKRDDLVKPDDKPVAPTVATLDPSTIETPGTTGPATGSGDGRATTGTGSGTDSGAAKAAGPPAPFITAEVMPEFMGGQEALQRFMQKNLHYPPQALRNNIEGRVYISFTVQADGSIADVEVLKGLGYGTDEEAARVVKKMPSWKPGMQNKHSVAVRYTMPITFKYE